MRPEPVYSVASGALMSKVWRLVISSMSSLPQNHQPEKEDSANTKTSAEA